MTSAPDPDRHGIEFYFDFVSPFAYLAFQQIGGIADRHDRMVCYRAIDLAVVKKAAGNTGPSNRDMPIKYTYLKSDLARWAALYGVPLVFPDPATAPAIGARDTRLAHHGVAFAERYGKAHDYIASFWRRSWGTGRYVGDADVIAGAVRDAGLDGDAFDGYVMSNEAAAAYADTIEDACSRGVFGVPTMFCDGEVWWGNDRLEMLDRFLSAAPVKRPGVETR